ncbi:MAG: DUF937 domain-containing protein [Pseudomonadota bacterium]
MNLTQLLVTQDNVDRLSAQFGLTEEQTLEAMAAVIPAFSEGLQRQASAPQSAASLILALASGRHGGYAHDAGLAVSEAGMADGRNILGHLFGSKDVSRGIASHAAANTGISSSIIKAMLPALASMVMGALFKGSTGRGSNGLGSMLGQAAGGGLLGTLIEGLAGGMLGQAKRSTRSRRRTSRSRRRRSSGGMGLEDILGQVLGGGRAAQQRPVDSDPIMPRSRRTSSRRTQRRQNPSGGLGDLLGELLGGNGTNNRRQRRANHQRTNQRGQEGIFGEMLQPGGRTTREDMRRTRSVFDEFLQG